MRRLAAILNGIVALAVVSAAIVLTVLSALGSLDVRDQLSAILGVLATLCLTYITDRFLVLSGIQSDLKQVAGQVATPTRLLRWAESPDLDSFVQGASSALIVGLTKAGPLTEGTDRLRNLIKQGCRVRILVLDGGNPSLYDSVAKVTTHTTERFLTDYHLFVAAIKDVRRGLTERENERLRVRPYPFPPTAGLILVHRRSEVTALVYLYSYKTDPKDRPTLVLRKGRDDEWLNFFQSHYEQMWADVFESLPDPTL